MALRQTLLPVPVRPAINKVRQRRKIDSQCIAAHVLAQEERNAHLLDFAVGLFNDFANAHDLPLFVGHFDADGIFAGNRRDDADAGHAEGDRQIVGQAGDFRQPQARFELDFVLRDDGTGFDFDDLHGEAEIEECLFENLGFAANFGRLGLEIHVVAGEQQFGRGQFIVFGGGRRARFVDLAHQLGPFSLGCFLLAVAGILHAESRLRRVLARDRLGGSGLRLFLFSRVHDAQRGPSFFLVFLDLQRWSDWLGRFGG